MEKSLKEFRAHRVGWRLADMHFYDPPPCSWFRAHRVGWRRTYSPKSVPSGGSSEPTVWDGD